MALNLHNPSNLYSGEAVVIDTKPYMNYMLQKEAKKKAKEEALDKYYADISSKVTTKGMRNEEIPALLAQKQDLQKYYIQNRDALTKGNDPNALMGFNERANKLQEIYTTSIGLNDINDTIRKTRATNPDVSDRWDEGTLQQIATHQKPAYLIQNGGIVPNPEHSQMKLDDFHFNPKLLDTKQMDASFDEIGKGIKPNSFETKPVPIVGDKYNQMLVTTANYDKDQLKTFGNDAMRKYDSDKSLKFTWDKTHPFQQWKDEHVSEFNNLNQKYKNVYGEDIKDDRDLHTAYALDRKSNEVVSQKQSPVFEARTKDKLQWDFDNWKKKNNITFPQQVYLAKLRSSLSAYEKAKTETEQAEGIKLFFEDLKSNSKPIEVLPGVVDPNGTVELPLMPQIVGAFALKDNYGGTKYPERIVHNPKTGIVTMTIDGKEQPISELQFMSGLQASQLFNSKLKTNNLKVNAGLKPTTNTKTTTSKGGSGSSTKLNGNKKAINW